jgi:uncharacterized protein YggU (UPF0235/DUF167 family)
MARLRVRVQPGARHPGVKGWLADGALKLAVVAPPEGGRANTAVADLLAALLGLKGREVRVVRGASSRSKLVEVDGLEEQEIRRRLSAALEASKADHGE